MARSVWFPRVFGGPALAERHAVTHEVSAIFKLRVLETPQARVHFFRLGAMSVMPWHPSISKLETLYSRVAQQVSLEMLTTKSAT
jgi:hypothetical protein